MKLQKKNIESVLFFKKIKIIKEIQMNDYEVDTILHK